MDKSVFGMAGHALIIALLDMLQEKQILTVSEGKTLFQEAATMLEQKYQQLKLPALRESSKYLQAQHDEAMQQKSGDR